MSDNDFHALMPLLLLAGASVLVMMLIVARLSHRIIQIASLILFIVSFSSLIYIRDSLPYHVDPLFVIDDFGAFMIGLIIFSGLVVNVLSYIYFEEKEEGPREYYVLLFLCTLGACVMAVSEHFISLFLGLEILTVGLYALIAYLRKRNHSIEAGIKYLILAAFSSAFLLFGMALIYLQTGSMGFSDMADALANVNTIPPLFLIGLGLMLVGIGFKLAVVPFHMWTADVYQGAPVPVTAFIATASKGGVVAVMLRFFVAIDGFRFEGLVFLLICIAIASMIVGNLLALRQTNIKRILAYSSIAHLGYLLVAFIPGSAMAPQAVSFYLLAYFATTLAAFGIVAVLSERESDAEELTRYKALFWKHPVLACILSSALLSLAGIPLTAGFTGKFYILATSLQSGFWLLAIVLVGSSVIGLHYYLRVITVMFSGINDHLPEPKEKHPLFFAISIVVLSILAVVIIWLGVYPDRIISFVQQFRLR
ncbi:NADH-quinone oxidoreductase subunit N [Dyadobacter pollutisoli]|uniref:NADH-quinone oxidoreductase subunit N n=1 Tax=Dyadobacter pollutisoli TaxID=2910158 RepID=A0A9E8SS19_9BACT|nr:NADH-quinone oxidoreductase subunit N [Dyadobacter pollutisoli]WAC14837.1 NADH-quinone oxidoreductase subunit N [Dyadobacter pollutisoli]